MQKKEQQLVIINEQEQVFSNKIYYCLYFVQELEINKMRAEVEKEFKMEEGPFNKGLDEALKSFNVQREAYYSGTFVGNHVHKCLKVHHPCSLNF